MAKNKNKLIRTNFDGFKLVLFREQEPPYDWVAHLKELPQVSAFGKTLIGSINELYLAWELYRESCLMHGERIPNAQNVTHKKTITMEEKEMTLKPNV